jgi:catechol 2,3-dioxygenase-like lactoylglutathione lyase family enzyme
MGNFSVRRAFHTGITVGDLDWSIGYFCSVLGYELLDKAPRDPKNQSFVSGVPGAQVTIAYIRGHGHELELLEFGGPDDRTAYRPRMVDVGHFHVCLVVDDVEAAVAASLAHDPRVKTVSPRPLVVDQGPNKGNSIQFVCLPDGLHIEFTTRRNE